MTKNLKKTVKSAALVALATFALAGPRVSAASALTAAQSANQIAAAGVAANAVALAVAQADKGDAIEAPAGS